MPIAWVAKVLDSEAGPPAVRLLFVELAFLADRKGIIRHSQTEIAGRTGMSRQQVAFYMLGMTAHGVLRKEHRGRYQWEEDIFNPDRERWLREVEMEPPDITEYISRVAEYASVQRQPIRDEGGIIRSRAETEEELKRISQARGPDEGIRYTKRGWPVLRHL